MSDGPVNDGPVNEAGLAALLAHLRADGYRFVTPTPATHARVNARPGNGLARSLTDVLGWSRPLPDGVLAAPTLRLLQDAGALTRVGDLWRPTLRVSSLDGMLFAHSAYPTEAADSVFFGPDTYRFCRALAAWLASSTRPITRAADIGCGAGAGALVVAKARPDAAVFGADINQAALRLTRINAAANGLQIQPRDSDLFAGLDGQFDLIVSNPPYLADPAERAYRHGGGPLGAALSLAILDAALPRLAPGGTLLLYTGAAIIGGHDPFFEAAMERLAGRDVSPTYGEIDPDVFGEELDQGPYRAADRIAAVLLTATQHE